MREVSANAWDIDHDVLCITTNCTLYHAETGIIQNVMGGGIAGEAARRFPNLPAQYAQLIKQHGHHVFLIGKLLMFPTKNEVRENSSLDVIQRSVSETLVLAAVYGWRNIALPRPGAGLGGLDWHTEVRPLLMSMIGDVDRFIVVSYPGED